MIIEQKEYQQRAIDDLVKSVSDLLGRDANGKVCVFQSPTGSGKTVMTAIFVDTLISENPDKDLCFLWISIGKGDLHIQSKKSLERIFAGFPNVHLLEDTFFGTRSRIEQNEVVVLNWEKLRNKDSKTGEWKNKVMREGENINFIEVIENTKEHRQIVLIIDESHYASDAQRTTELRDIINADVTLEMSATPKITAKDIAEQLVNKTAYYVKIDPKDVIEAGMIKKELVINDNIGELVDDERTSQDVILEAAYNKRLALKEAYQSAGVNINPLCLIQLPNAEAGEAKREVIEVFLAERGITEANGKLAVWLSEDKSDSLDEISDFESDVEFLLFKQAIDTGWDCPRAHILVKLRDIKSYTFEVQTVGRILRMPQHKHYDDETLNIGYIYTNLTTITVAKEEYNPNIIKHLKVERIGNYQELKLQSYYKNRVDFGVLTPSFYETLGNVFCAEFGLETNPTIVNFADNEAKIKAKGLTTEKKSYQEQLLTNKVIDGKNVDTTLGVLNNKDDETVKSKLADNDLQDKFNAVVQENLNGFAPKRSVPTAKVAIFQWFRKYLGINPFVDGGAIQIQNLILHPNNIELLSRLLNKATSDYKPIQKEEIKGKIEETFYDWDVKKEEFFNQYTDERADYSLSVFQPCYLEKGRSTAEREFEIYLENKADTIEWWYKNGKQKKDYFGIRYYENDLPQTFYPDYIIQLKSGKVFIGDTKDGITADSAKSRAEALQAYIKEQNAKGMNVIGGIIIKDNKQWRVNQQAQYKYDKNDLREWTYFEELL